MRKRAAPTVAAVGSSARASGNGTSTPSAASVGSHRHGRGPGWLPFLPLIMLCFFAALLTVTMQRHAHLPSPKDASSTPASEFSEERAREHLDALTRFGVRTTGNIANEVHAVRYILEQLSLIQIHLVGRPDAQQLWELHVAIQRPSGSFDLDFLNGFTSSYQNVTNILARLAPKGRRASGDPVGEGADPLVLGGGASLLISGHFDSALGTVAATDDVANIANMLEVLRALTYRPEGPLDAPVIFLFNGAEETILQASHGFITQHPWAKDVAAFINLEGAGGSGRELVFQTGPKHHWIASAYSHAAPYPFASILAQDIFQSGVIPSDTDFRVYRDFGQVPGIDVAYISNGYVYHTALDTVAQVERGSLQRCGENLLATIAALANSPYLALTHRNYKRTCEKQPRPGGNIASLVAKHESSSRSGRDTALTDLELKSIVAANVCLDVSSASDSGAVYFDLLGFCVLIYSVATSMVVNWVVIGVVAVYLLRQIYTKRKIHHNSVSRSARVFASHVGLTLLSLVGAAAAAVSVGCLLALIAPMSWFRFQSLVGGLFLTPALLVYCALQRRFLAGAAGKKQKHDDDVPVPAGSEADSFGAEAGFTHPPWLLRAFQREEAAYDAALACWKMLLLGLTIARVGSAFLALSWCVVPLFARSVARRFEVILHSMTHTVTAPSTSAGVVPALPSAQRERAPKGILFLVAYLAGLVLPAILFLQASLVIFSFFTPLMGRSGTTVPSDVVIAGIFGTLLGVAGVMVLSVVHLLCNWRAVRNILVAVVVACVIFALTPAGFTYSPSTPKRLYLVHVGRQIHRVGWDSRSDVTHLLGVPSTMPPPSSAAPTAGAQARATRRETRSSLPAKDTSLWFISMDFQNQKPLEHSIRVPPHLVGRTASELRERGIDVWEEPVPPEPEEEPSVWGSMEVEVVDEPAEPRPAHFNLFDLAQVQNCSSNRTDTAARLFCDLPYFLPLPSFVPGNILIPLPDRLGPAWNLRPQLLLEKVENFPPESEGGEVRWVRKRRLHFAVRDGPSHMTLFINNRPGMTLVRQWSFGDSVEHSARLNRSSLGEQYEKSAPEELFVFFASGMPFSLNAAPLAATDEARDLEITLPGGRDLVENFGQLKREWNFWLEVADDLRDVDARTGAPFLDLALAGHYLDEQYNELTTKVAQHLPEWITPVSFTSFHDSFQF